MPTVTLSDLQSRIYNRVDGNTVFYPLSEVTSAINEGIRVLNAITGYIQKTVAITGYSQANRHFYDVPSAVLVPLRVAFEGRYLHKTGLTTMGYSRPRWRAETTASTGIPVSTWLPIGLRKFAIHPADSRGGGDLQVTGVAEPTPLVNLTDKISFPNEWSELLEDYGFYTLVLKEGGKIFADASLLYHKFIRKIKMFMRWQGMRFPQYAVERESPK